MAEDGGADAPGWSRHVIAIDRAVEAGLGIDAGGLRAGLADDALWRQEYLCEWLDEAGAWLPWELIDSCLHADAGDPARFAGGAAFIGVDIAARAHLWAAWALELVGDVAWTRELRVLRGGTFAERDDALAGMIRRFRPVRVAADATGVGAAAGSGCLARASIASRTDSRRARSAGGLAGARSGPVGGDDLLGGERRVRRVVGGVGEIARIVVGLGFAPSDG